MLQSVLSYHFYLVSVYDWSLLGIIGMVDYVMKSESRSQVCKGAKIFNMLPN